MTAISFVNASTVASSASSPMNANLPASYVAGDLLVAFIMSREDSPTPVHGITTSSVSWTQVDTTQFLDLGNNGISLSVWWRFAESASETTPSVSCPTPLLLGCDICAFRNVDTVTPTDGITSVRGTNAAAQTLQPGGAGGISTQTNGAWLVSAVSTSDDNTLTLSTANGFTARLSGASGNVSTNGSLGVATKEIATAGSGNTSCTWNQSANGNDAWAYNLFVLKPKPDLPPALAYPGLFMDDPRRMMHPAREWW